MSATAAISARAAFQRRRATSQRSNNSLRRTYDLLLSSLQHSMPAGTILVEDELVDTLSASRNTVRAALQLLANDGFVDRGPRVGTTARPSTLLPLNELLTVDDKAQAYQLRRESLEASVIPAPAIVARWLRLPLGAPVALMEALVLQHHTPIGIWVSYVALPPGLEVAIGEQIPDAIGFLEGQLKVNIGHADSTVAAVAADRETAKLLGVPEGAPTLWLEDYVRDVDGCPRAVCQLRYRGDRVAFSAVARRSAS